MDKKDKQVFQSFCASRQRITWEQALQIPTLNEAIQIVNDLPVTFVHRFKDEFFIAEISDEKGTLWVMPGETFQHKFGTLEEAQFALFTEFRDYVVDVEEDADTDEPETNKIEASDDKPDKDWIVNYKWLFMVYFTNAYGLTKANYPYTSFGPDYQSAKNFLLIRMKNKNQQLHQILSVTPLAVHFAYYPNFKDVPEELYKSIPLPKPPKQL